LSEAEKIKETLKRFLDDRRDVDFTRVVKLFLSGSDQEQWQAFLFALTSAKVFANIILDRGELTPSNALLMKTIDAQMARVLQETGPLFERVEPD
jgi:hypothetical protein